MSKRKAREGKQQQAADLYIPDDLWGVIADCIAWDDVKSLSSFLCVSRDAIRFVLPRVKELCEQFQRPHYDRTHPLIRVVLRHLFRVETPLPFSLTGRSDKLSPVQRKELRAFSFEELKTCMRHFHRLEESALTTREWREHSATLLSIVRLPMLHNELCIGESDSSVRFRAPMPSDRVSSLFHSPLGSPRATQRLKKVANLRVVQNMATYHAQLITDTERWLATNGKLSERERVIYSLALKSARGNHIRAVCYYIMADAYKVCKATYGSFFRDIVLLDEKKEAVHVYTQGSTVIDNFVGRCLYYDGSTKEACKAIELETYMDMYKLECSQRCRAMKNLFLEKASITSKVWEHAPVPPSLLPSSEEEEEVWHGEETHDIAFIEEGEEEEEEEEVFIMPLLGSQ